MTFVALRYVSDGLSGTVAEEERKEYGYKREYEQDGEHHIEDDVYAFGLAESVEIRRKVVGKSRRYAFARKLGNLEERRAQ